jgi:transketolase
MTVTMRDRFAEVTEQLLEEEDRLTVVLADIGGDRLARAQHRRPGRVINVGIREQLLIGVAGGLALEGRRPLVHSYAPFLVERPFEQIKLDLGHQDVGAVLVSIGASYDAPREGRTHQAPGDVALLDTLDGWTVHVPGHADEAELHLRRAVAGDGRVYLRLSGKQNSSAHVGDPDRFTVLRHGGGGTVAAIGPMLDPVLAAVAGLDVTVLYASTVRPFDRVTLATTLGDPSVVLVEPYLAGTSAGEVAAALGHVAHRLLTLGVQRSELRRYGSPRDHARAHGLDAEGLRSNIGAFLGAAAA